MNTWGDIKRRFHISDDRYNEFEYLLFLDINDPFIENYVHYHLGLCEPLIKGRLKMHIKQWEKLHPPTWILSLINDGLKIPFISEPPVMVLPNNKTANLPENIPW